MSTYIVHSLDITRLARPTHASHGTIGMLIAAMRDYGRHELVHYAGAAHRDSVAWELCLAWLCEPDSLESELLARAINAGAAWRPLADITAADIRAANPGIDASWQYELSSRINRATEAEGHAATVATLVQQVRSTLACDCTRCQFARRHPQLRALRCWERVAQS